MANDKPRERGRPEIEYDLEKVEIFGRFKATYETMADHFGVSVRSIERQMSPSNDPETEFCRAYKKGYTELKMKLSEAQIHNAIVENNATLQVWLGKQYLGQTDKQEIKQESDVNLKANVDLEGVPNDVLDKVEEMLSPYVKGGDDG